MQDNGSESNALQQQEAFDRMISNCIQASQYEVPEELDQRLTEFILNPGKSKLKAPEFLRHYSFNKKLWLRWSVSMTFGMILLLAIFTLQPPIKPHQSEPASNISEIKTEFELSDKNIKILWVQKKDFELKRSY